MHLLRNSSHDDKNGTCVRIFISSLQQCVESGTFSSNWSLKSKLGRADTNTEDSLSLFFNQEGADIPFGRLSDSNLPESDESDERHDDDHGGLPDGEAGDHEGTDYPDEENLHGGSEKLNSDG